MRIHIIAAILGLAAATPAYAQPAGATPPGLQFAGCWNAADGMPSRSRICVVPQADAQLKFVTLGADGTITESPLRIDGARVDVKAEGCEGWEEARLTADGERILVNSEIACRNEPRQKRESAFAIAPSGFLVQVSGSGLAMIANAQIRVYRPVDTYGDIPLATREQVMPYLIDAEMARLEARRHPVSARDLAEFERLDVSTPIIDVLVAASYPQSFVIDASGSVASAPVPERTTGRHGLSGRQVMFMNGFPMLSMYDWDMLYACARLGGWSCPLSTFRYSRYGYGEYFNPLFPGGYWPGYGIPVVVRPATPPSDGGTAGGSGRAVRGRGYTSDGNGAGTAQPRSSSGGSGASMSSGSSGNSSSGASSSGSSGGSSSGGGARTAKPRDP